jgi:hypothetical protein
MTIQRMDHLAFAVDDIDAALANPRARGTPLAA